MSTNKTNSIAEVPQQSTAIIEEKIPTKEKVADGFANMGNGLLSGLGLGAIDLFYLKFTGIDPEMLALSWIIFIIWNAVNDPLIGIIEDKTKSKLGRRVPYLRYGVVIYLISFLVIWYPFTTNTQLLFWNHLAMLFIFDTLYSMIGLITYSLPAEMALTAKERSSIIVFSAIIGAIGIAGSIILPIVFLGDSPNILGFRIAMIVCGIVGGTVIFVGSYYIKENKYAQLEPTLGMIDSVKETFKNKPFLILEVMIFASTIMQNILTSYLLFVTDYLIDFDLKNIWNIVIAALLIGILVYLILKISNFIEKFGLKKTIIGGSALGAFGFLLLLIIGLAYNTNASNKLPMIIGLIPLLFVLIGLFGYMFTGQPLMADAIDNDELLTGKRRETSYSGVNALITKPAVSIGHAAFLYIIKYYGYINTVEAETGLPPPPIRQPVGVATGVLIAFTVIPIICLVIGIISMKFYPLDGAEWNKKKRSIQETHARKEKEYYENIQREAAENSKQTNQQEYRK